MRSAVSNENSDVEVGVEWKEDASMVARGRGSRQVVTGDLEEGFTAAGVEEVGGRWECMLRERGSEGAS
jgi:hypothetical protein